MHRQLNLNYQYNLVDDDMIAAFQPDATACASCGGISPVYPAERSRADALESMVGASIIQSAVGPKWRERLSFCGVKCEKAMFSAISEIKARGSRGKEEEGEIDTNEALADLLYNMPPKCKVLILYLFLFFLLFCFLCFAFYIFYFYSLFLIFIFITYKKALYVASYLFNWKAPTCPMSSFNTSPSSPT